MDFEFFKKVVRFDEKWITSTEATFVARVTFNVRRNIGNIDSIDDVSDSMHECLTHDLYRELQKEFGNGYTSDDILAAYQMGQTDGVRYSGLNGDEVLRRVESLKGQA